MFQQMWMLTVWRRLCLPWLLAANILILVLLFLFSEHRFFSKNIIGIVSRFPDFTEDRKNTYTSLLGYHKPFRHFHDLAIKSLDESSVPRLLNHIRFTLREQRNTNKRKILNISRNTMRFREYAEQSLENSYRVIQHELNLIDEILGFKDLRITTAHNLSTVIYNRINHLQNPPSEYCGTAIVCNLTNPNGLASGVHDALWCLVQAYHLRRRVSLDTSNWHYAPGENWKELFRPLSEACPVRPAENQGWPTDNTDPESRRFLNILPEDLAPDLLRLNDNPLPFWYGQFLGYLLRPSDKLNKFINDVIRNTGFASPIVGIHVRRTDKLNNEATYHGLDSYISEAENFFQSWELKHGKELDERRIFLATDDPQVAKDCEDRFPEYRFLRWDEGAELSKNLTTRYTQNATWDAVLDVFLLSRTDFIVCTLSSGLCRLAYELMQFNRPESLSDVHSLDVPHHYAYVTEPRRKSVYRHKALSRKEIDMRPGDVMTRKDAYSVLYEAIAGKVNDGYTKGKNNRTRKIGIFPTYKTIPVLDILAKDLRTWENCSECLYR